MFSIYENWWGITLYVITLYIIYSIYQSVTTIQEGFESGNVVIPEELKKYACHGIKRTLEANNNLLEGYENAGAIGSLADVKSIINTLTSKWNEMDCERIVLENPLPVVHMLTTADVVEEVTERVTAQINAEIEAKKAGTRGT